MNNANNTYRLLMIKEIYSILLGDKQFEDYTFKDNKSTIKVSMPYLKGSQLCDISSVFGLPQSYSWGGGNLSRWQYLDELFKFCIQNDKCSDLLSYLFDKRQFQSLFSELDLASIDTVYKHFVQRIIEEINRILYFGHHELAIIKKSFIVRSILSNVDIDAPNIKSINREYVRDISNRAISDVENGDYDSALTKSRTMIEEVFCYVLEVKGVTHPKSGNINELYRQVKSLYNMHYEDKTDVRIKMLLSGLEKILSSIAEMRNLNSDSHGVGSSRLKIDKHHARLFVNSAMTMADFILSVAYKQNHALN